MGDRHGVTPSAVCEYSIIAQSKEAKSENELQKIPKFGKRHIQAVCLFLSLAVALTVRAQLSVTIVAMTDIKNPQYKSQYNTAKHYRESFNSTPSSPYDTRMAQYISKDTLENNLGWSVYRTYNWSKSTQEMVTTSFFVGYTTMQIPMGVIAQRYGGKLPILVALFVNGILSIVTPWFAILGWWVVCFCRFIQGLTQAAMYPGIQTMVAKWSPMSERGRLCTRIFTGSQFGTIVAFQLSGLLAGSPVLGWPSAFWVSGLMSLACFVLLATLGAATPDQHPTITQAEKEYIAGHAEDTSQVKLRTPWRAILNSVPVWAMVAAHAGSTFSYIFLLVEMPLYMSKILHVDVKNSGLLSSLPYIAMWTTSIFMGQLSDFVINHRYLSVISVRRIANTVGMMVCGLLMVAFSFAQSVPVAIVLLVLSVASHAGVQVGFLVNQIDLAPNFAGTLMAIANLIGNFVTLASPALVSFIVTDVENQSQWQIVFMISAGVMIVSNVIFVVFLKVDVQTWDKEEYNDKSEPESQYEKIEKVLFSTPQNARYTGSSSLEERETQF